MTGELPRSFCPLMSNPENEGKPRECMEAWCGAWYEASDPQYSRCSFAEIARQLCSIRFEVSGDNGKSKGKATKKGAPPA